MGLVFAFRSCPFDARSLTTGGDGPCICICGCLFDR